MEATRGDHGGGTETPVRPDAMVREKRRAAGASVLAGLALTVLKLAAGLTSGSLGLLAEAAHSALDTGAAIMTWFAVARPRTEPVVYPTSKLDTNVPKRTYLLGTIVILATLALYALFW